IHDDIEDRSARRRGKAALHLVYGEDTAINAGAFLYILPLACLEAWDGEAEAKNAIWALWARHMRALHLGQSMDIAWHRGEGLPSPSDYETMCSLKTGCLARFAALLGAEAALGPGTRESGSEAAIAGRAAEQWGVGFQILDDVKNLTTGLPGKQRGDDIVEGKMSLPVLYFVWGPDPAAESEADPERLALVRRCCAAARSGGTGVPEVEELISALAAAGSIGAAANRGRALIGEASAALSALPVRDRAAGRLLAELPAVLQERME
ncbi:MAG: polyprenyl synthetase family protein, partial [Treponema sp.]|nr:polyprenyl synthetase family protein [Treponema sp.]